jgi:hypothetical protein
MNEIQVINAEMKEKEMEKAEIQLISWLSVAENNYYSLVFQEKMGAINFRKKEIANVGKNIVVNIFKKNFISISKHIMHRQ